MVDYTCDFQDIVRYYEGKKITLNCAFDVYSGLKPNISSDVDKMIRHMNDIKIVCANSSSGKQELFALKHTEELIRNVYKKQIKFK